MLVALAWADGEFERTERDFILSLATKQGLTGKELKELLKSGKKMSAEIQDLEFDDKVEILTFLIKLMKVDGKVLLSEIRYCEKIAGVFGFEKKAVGFLTSSVEDNPNIDPNVGRIRFRMRKYLAKAS